MNTSQSDALVFFGATGDLAFKKIFPALQAMAKSGQLDVPVIGVGRSTVLRPQIGYSPVSASLRLVQSPICSCFDESICARLVRFLWIVREHCGDEDADWHDETGDRGAVETAGPSLDYGEEVGADGA
jgi:hypothetical protein